jgi:hypothetical protein
MASGRSEKVENALKGQRNHQEQSSVNRVGRRPDGEEWFAKPHRRGKALLQGKDGQVGQLPECTVSDGLWEEISTKGH